MSRTLANTLLLLAGAIWGMGFVAQQTAMDDIGPMLFVTLRFLLAGIVVTPFALRELKNTQTPGWLAAVSANRFGFGFVGCAFFLGMSFQQIGLLTTSVTNAGFLTALYVVMVPFIMISLLRKPQPAIIWPAALLAIAGIYLLSGGDLMKLNGGDLLIVACALFWAIHVIATAHWGRNSGLPITMAVIQFFVTATFGLFSWLVIVSMGLGETVPTMDKLIGAAPEVIYAATIAGGLGFTLQAIGQRHTSESAAAVLLSTESLFAALFGTLLLGEQLSYVGYIGCAMIFVAILIVELMPSRRKLDA